MKEKLGEVITILKQISLVSVNEVLEERFSNSNQADKAVYLNKMGYSNADIAKLINITPRAVSVKLVQGKKKTKK